MYLWLYQSQLVGDSGDYIQEVSISQRYELSKMSSMSFTILSHFSRFQHSKIFIIGTLLNTAK